VRLTGIDTGYPEIPTIPSPFERITDVVQRLPVEDIIDKLVSAFDTIQSLLNSPDIPETLHLIKQTLEEAKRLVNNLDSRTQSLTADLAGTVGAYKKLALDVDAEVKPLASRVNAAINNTSELVQDVDHRAQDLARATEKTLEKAQEALIQGREALQVARKAVDKDSPLMYQLDQTLKEISSMARSIRSLADFLERHPDALLYGKGKPERR